ncbi:MAG: DUF3592 domain-containing protein [Caulobacteraceae bacterium]
MTSETKIWIIGITLGVGLILNLFVQWTANRLVRRAEEAEAWPIAQARLIKAWVWSARGNNTPHLRYEYEAAGRTWQGRRVLFGRWASTLAVANDFLAGLRKSPTFPVRYDPANPAFSVVLAEAKVATRRSVGVGVILLSAVVALLIWVGGR